MAADNDSDAHNPNDEPKQISRRALLKELSKAPGVMGALMIPTAWATPLMEFAVGAAYNRCSTTPDITACSGSVLSLPFGSGTSVSWSAAWYGLIPGTAIVATLDAANKAVRVAVGTPFTITGWSASTSLSNGVLGWTFDGSGTKTASMGLTTNNGVKGTTCSFASGFLPATVSFSMDMTVTGTSATGYALSVNNFRSPNC